MSEEFKAVIEMLEQITQDRTVPRNIKDKCLECIDVLKNEGQAREIRINTVTSALDEVSNDPNLPLYTRTHIWNIVSSLEAL